jgi:hypothetical protein
MPQLLWNSNFMELSVIPHTKQLKCLILVSPYTLTLWNSQFMNQLVIL